MKVIKYAIGGLILGLIAAYFIMGSQSGTDVEAKYATFAVVGTVIGCLVGGGMQAIKGSIGGAIVGLIIAFFVSPDANSGTNKPYALFGTIGSIIGFFAGVRFGKGGQPAATTGSTGSFWNSQDFQQLEQDINKVRAARTGGEADRAASRTVGHFSQDVSDRRTSLVAQLNALWNGGELYNVSSGPKLNEFKRLLVLWLESVLHSRKTSPL